MFILPNDRCTQLRGHSPPDAQKTKKTAFVTDEVRAVGREMDLRRRPFPIFVEVEFAGAVS